MARTVVDRQGHAWTLGRRWAPRLGDERLWTRFGRRYRSVKPKGDGALDGADAGFELADAVPVLAIVAVVLLAIFFFVPVLVAVIDLLLVLLLAAIGIASRMLFRRPWTLEARNDAGVRHRWKVVGWRASGAKLDDIESAIAAGITLTPDETAVRPDW